MSFGKESDPRRDRERPAAPRSSPASRPAVGCSPRPSAGPIVYSTPLVAWKPATGATAYQVQWSKIAVPVARTGTVKTLATSSLLDLGPGTWYYRVRGLNQAQLRKAEMAWSRRCAVKVARPTFSISAG